MPWQADYDALKETDKEQFARTLSLLFEQTFLVRDVWDSKEQRLVGNREYRFADRMRPLLEEYLHVSGWALQVDSHRGVIALYNRFGRNRLALDKLTTYALFTLRLIYDEHMERVSQRREIVIALREVIEKLHTFGVVDKRLPVSQLQATMMRLRRLSVVERIEGEGVEADSRWLLYPSIRLIVPDDRVNLIFENLETLAGKATAGDADAVAAADPDWVDGLDEAGLLEVAATSEGTDE